MSEEQEMPERGHGVESIVRLLKGQISQEFDAYRMLQCWPGVLSEADPKDVATALVRVLSHGQYVPREARPHEANITITCLGGDPEAIAEAVARYASAVT